MRLTVRTLLAWIDQVLGPDDQRSLGEKVAASSVAPKIVERTRAVVGHDGLSAPSPEGRGLADDPNSAAEFLDNVLAGDRLEAFERICIESDIHLAEAAACHGMLAEITRDPRLIEPLDPRQRERLVAAAGRRGAAGAPADRASPPAVPRHAAAKGRAAVSPKGESPSGRPRDRRRASLAAWLSAAAAVGLLAVLGGGLVWSLVRGAPARSVREVASGEPAAPPQAAPAARDDEPAQAQRSHVPESGIAADKPAAPAAGGHQEEARQPMREESAASPPAPAAETSVAPVVRTAEAPRSAPASAAPAPPAAPAAAVVSADRRVPQGDALAIVAPQDAAMPDGPAPRDAAAAAAPPGAADVAAVPAAGLTAGDVVGEPLLHREIADEARPWLPLAAGTSLADRADLLAPPGCHPSFTVDGVTIRLQPNTRAVLSRDAEGLPRLEVVFGRAVVSSPAADAKLGVTAAGLSGVVSGVLRQPAGIEVAVERDPAAVADAAQPRRRATLHAGGAEKIWRQTSAAGAAADRPLAGIAPEAVLAARATLEWDERDPGSVVVGPPAAEPAWMRSTASADRNERAAVRSLADRLAAAEDVEQALRGMAGERRAEERMIAAATLALLGEYDDLVSLLCDESPRTALNESQWTALEAQTVPLALGRGEHAAAKLGQAFADRGPAGKADTLLALARRPSDADLAAGGDAMLVESLDDGSLAVRRYAIRRLVEIVQPEGRNRTTYRADRPPLLRRDGAAWWRAQLERGRIRRGLPDQRPATSAPVGAPGSEDE